MIMNVKILLAFIISLFATLGSLFFSEVMELPPCSLCWYQRICMYPLVFIFLIGFVDQDKKVSRYAWPLCLLGIFIALYHNLLIWEIIPESAAPCREGVSCSTQYFDWFGFISIPFLSLMSFLSISLCLKGSQSEK